jgi:Ca2+-binding RTX toxin-like protein
VTLTGITRIDAGAGNDSIVGSALADTIVGGAGDDALAGGGGNDVFQVGLDAGRDAYDGGAGTDQITATANNVVIGISSITGIETISGGKFSGVVVAGTDAADLLDFSGVALSAIARIEGGAGTDTLTGSGAADRIYGGSGADAVLGGAGADILRGDAGADTLVGGVGKDQFQYTSVKDSLVGQADVIRDFARGEDKIDLSLIDANLATAKDDAFRLIGNASFSGTAAEVRWAYDQVTNTTQILGNLAGDLTADFEIRLEGNVALDARTDFLG